MPPWPDHWRSDRLDTLGSFRPTPAKRQLNFLRIFSFGLAAVTFTLENTEPTTVHFLLGMATTLPLAVLLLLVGGSSAPAAAPAEGLSVD